MDRSSQGRYERKYMLSEATAVAIRAFVSAYLPHDQYMRGADERGYHVHSLYLDTPHFDLYRRSVENAKNRYKLRIRFYDLSTDGPAFLEIKRRVGDTILKQRAMVSKPVAAALLDGRTLSSTDLLSSSDAAARALADFTERRGWLGAEGTVFVSYQREAFAAPAGDGTRITLDRYVAALPYEPAQGVSPARDFTPLTPACVVLELKHFGPAPRWINDLVTTFGLRRTAFPKYVRCLDAMHPHLPRGAFARAALVPYGEHPHDLA